MSKVHKTVAGLRQEVEVKDQQHKDEIHSLKSIISIQNEKLQNLENTIDSLKKGKILIFYLI